MAELEFLKATEEHATALSSIWAHVYGDGNPPEEPYQFKPLITPSVVTVDGIPAWAATVNDYHVWREGIRLAKPWACGGVAAVATLAEFRNQGVSTVGMKGLLRQMFEGGQLVSSLYPFRESYYRRFGYEFCGWRWQIKALAHRLPKLPCDLPVRRVFPKDFGILKDCHDQMVQRLSGSPVRDDLLWERRLGSKPPIIMAVGDPVEAYFWATPKEFWGDLSVGELVWSTPRGYQAALEVMRGMASNQTTVTWFEPPQSPFIDQHMDQGAQCSIHRATMFRVINVPALVATVSDPPHPVFLEVSDPDIPENNGPWRICGGPAGTLCQPTVEPPQVKMSIQTFSQLVMGGLSLSQLKNGMAEYTSEQALADLAGIFPPANVCCMEFF